MEITRRKFIIGASATGALILCSKLWLPVSKNIYAAELVSERRINSKTFTLTNGQTRLLVSQAPIHYKDDIGGWQDINDQFSEASDVTGFTAKFSKCYHMVVVGDNGSRRIYPDRNDRSYWIQIDKPNGINMSNPVKTGNTWIWDYAHAQIIIQMQGSQVKFSFVLKDSQAPTSITIPFSTQGITRSGNLLLHNSVIVGILTKPTARDANSFIPRTVNATFNTNSVTLTLDTTGITQDSYPIDIDPTVNLQVVTGTDDCVRLPSSVSGNAADYYDNVDGAFQAGYNEPVGGYSWVGCAARLTGITVPQGSTISSCVMKLTAKAVGEANGRDTVNTRIRCQDADDAATFSTKADFDARSWTTNYAYWDAIEHWTTDVEYTSPDFSSSFQAVVNRAGWASGNNAAVLWDDWESRSSTASTYTLRYAYSYNGSSTKAPKMDITYASGVATFIPTTEIL